ncbi:unnamed protein product, partial [marine sediment metagenome]
YNKGEILKSFQYRNFIPPAGLAWDGKNIWINYFATGGQTSLHEIDTASGQIIKQFGTPYGIWDIDFDGENLLLYGGAGGGGSWDILKLNPLNGSSAGIIETPFFGGLANRGIACRDNEIWVVNWGAAVIAVIDKNGELLGAIDTNVLDDCGSCYDAGFHTCFMDDKFIITKYSQVFIFQIAEIN